MLMVFLFWPLTKPRREVDRFERRSARENSVVMVVGLSTWKDNKPNREFKLGIRGVSLVFQSRLRRMGWQGPQKRGLRSGRPNEEQ